MLALRWRIKTLQYVGLRKMHKPENVSRVVFSVTTLEYHTVQSAVANGYKLTRALLGYLAERAPLWGAGADSAPCLTRERAAVARRARRQSKAPDK